MIQFVGIDLGDILAGQHTRSHKQQLTNVALLTRILDTRDHKSYVDAHEKLE